MIVWLDMVIDYNAIASIPCLYMPCPKISQLYAKTAIINFLKTNEHYGPILTVLVQY